MDWKARIAIALLCIAVSASELRAQGANVVLSMKNGQEIEGELLTVRDSLVILATVKGLKDEELATHPEHLTVLASREIEHIIVKGESKILSSMGKGILYGGAAGGIIGFLSGDDRSGFIRFSAAEKALAIGVAFGTIGFLIGTISGIASSTGDTRVDPLPNFDFSALKRAARYQVSEPAYLMEF